MNMRWYKRIWRHFVFLAYQVIGLNTVWLPFVGLCKVPCLYHHCQQSLLNWKGDYRCSGTCYQRQTCKRLGRNGIRKRGLLCDLGLLSSVCRARRKLSEILYWSIQAPAIINANFNYYKFFKMFTSFSELPCIYQRLLQTFPSLPHILSTTVYDVTTPDTRLLASHSPQLLKITLQRLSIRSISISLT
jgi:hypothetical protein